VPESEALFRSIANSAPVMIWMSGPDKLCTYFNKPWLDFTGRSFDAELGNGWAENVHPDDLQHCLSIYTRSFDSRAEFQMEYRLRRYDGEFRWILDRGVSRFDPDGSFAGYIGSCIDVTDAKTAEESRRQSEVRFRQAARAGKMFAYEWDVATDAITRSGEYADILGMDENTPITGQEVLNKTHPEDRDRVVKVFAQLTPAKPDAQLSYRMVRPDGEILWVERKSRAHFDDQGKLLRVSGMVADITDRKAAEKQLDLFHHVFMEASLGIAVENLEGRILLANPALGSILGYSTDELLDLTCDSLADPEDAQEDGANFEKLSAGLIDRYAIEKRFRRKDSAQIWGQLNVSLIENSDGSPPLVLALVEDITERKNAEEALNKKDAELIEAQHLASLASWQWDPEHDVVQWSEELYRIIGRDPHLPAPTFQEHQNFYTHESWVRLQQSVTKALQDGSPYEIDLEMVRANGTKRWITARGSAKKDALGRVTSLRGTVQDITARKLVEESQTLFRKLLDGSNDAFEVLDPETMHFLDVNDQACRDLGYSREELLTKTIYDIGPEAGATYRVKLLREMQQSGFVIFESTHRRKDGSTFPVEVNIKHIQLDRGYIVSIARDITERKRVEETLRRNELNYRMFISQSSEGIFCEELDEPIPVDLPEEEQIYRIHHQSYLSECNDAMARMYSLPSAAGMVGKRLTQTMDVKDPSNIELTREFIRNGYRVTDRESHENDLKGNKKIFLNSMMGIVENGMLLRTWGIQRDVTDRWLAEEAKKHAEQALRESEQRLRLATLAGRMYAYEWDALTDEVVHSPESIHILGGETNAAGDEDTADVYPDDRGKVRAAKSECTPENPTCRVSYRVIRKDGSIIWMEKTGRAYFDKNGKMLRMIGMVADITERKLAEEALSSVSRRLIEAQETERRRIARDLHDDIGQRLALLAVTIEQLKETPADSEQERQTYIQELQNQTSEIAADLQAISHELHSAKLEHLGLVAAMSGFCKELSMQQKVDIVFTHQNIPHYVRQEISLCLFRVLQEGLHNAVKYSGVRHFEVELVGTIGAIHLTIHDSGSGFDPEAAMRGRGLGLTSMQERLKLVDGEIFIESQPQRGTTIRAVVPNPATDVSLRAAS
jgi:PAS domain S-box-containing protein